MEVMKDTTINYMIDFQKGERNRDINDNFLQSLPRELEDKLFKFQKVNYNTHLNFNYIEDNDTSIMCVYIHRSLSNVVAIFHCILLLLDTSVDILV